jgi:hypothetical protein
MKKDGEILVAEASGVRTYDTVTAISKEIVDACREKGTQKVLIDVQALDGKLNMFDAFRIASTYFGMIRDRTVLNQAAIVDLKTSESRYKFFETVAVNRGYNIRIFNNVEEALEWLT